MFSHGGPGCRVWCRDGLPVLSLPHRSPYLCIMVVSLADSNDRTPTRNRRQGCGVRARYPSSSLGRRQARSLHARPMPAAVETFRKRAGLRMGTWSFDRATSARLRDLPAPLAYHPRMGNRGTASPPRLLDLQLAYNWARATLVDVVYPRRCAGCARRGRWLCEACDAALPRFAPPWCDRCGVPASVAPCRCADLPPAIAAVRSVAWFEGWLREAIIGFKYQGEWSRAEHLAAALLPALHDAGTVDAIVPVPLHPSRMRLRGYNQSELLARHAGAALRIPVQEVLVRRVATLQQVRLSADQRRHNVAGAFMLPDHIDIAGQRLVLIDDVVTTGSTLASCASVLRQGGAREVWAAALARER